MAACPACSKENPEGSRFCDVCAAPLTGENREQRKTVTVLFCDVTGSTALGESTDPEALRALLARYFERMQGDRRVAWRDGGEVHRGCGDGGVRGAGRRTRTTHCERAGRRWRCATRSPSWDRRHGSA